ncbi:hypothetical protein EJ110_NYTH49523 [Nymphaea thermarum]|nr:hypothetical protein EJ110_NYTH49523 [Nymphaea thermarum]
MENQTIPEISLHALAGDEVLHLMRVGKFRGRPVSVLIDMGSTHNFICEKSARALGCHMEVQPAFGVVVGDGSTLRCRGKFQMERLEIQGFHFFVQIYILAMAAADLVLGIQSLLELGEVVWDFVGMKMQFKGLANERFTLEASPRRPCLEAPAVRLMKGPSASFLLLSTQSPRVWDSFCDRGVSAVLAPPPVLSFSLPQPSLPALFPPLPSLLPAPALSLLALSPRTPPPSPLLLRRHRHSCAVSLSCFSGVGYCLSLEIVMATEMTPKIDVAFDTGSNPKSKNVPVQVTSIRLNKDNYLSWSAALEIGITSRGCLPYIAGEKPAPSKTDPSWATWALEDSQVKVWIISSISADIQPLILRKSTSYDMWIVFARMYGRKKRVLRTYQIKRSIYSLTQSDLSVASFYAALKTKWEELDYHVNDDWSCGSDHALYWQKEWMDWTFIFLGGLRDEFESIRSHILNCDETPGIEEVYALVESEEQRRQGLGSVLLGIVASVTSWGILLISVGIFILRRGSPVVVLLLVGEVLLCPTLVMVALQVLKNQSFPLTKSRNCKLISAGYPLLRRTPPRLRSHSRLLRLRASSPTERRQPPPDRRQLPPSDRLLGVICRSSARPLVACRSSARPLLPALLCCSSPVVASSSAAIASSSSLLSSAPLLFTAHCRLRSLSPELSSAHRLTSLSSVA